MLQLTVFCGPLARSLVRSYGEGVIGVEPIQTFIIEMVHLSSAVMRIFVNTM